jgi:3-hydroxybutyryl-CoA dehydrogenase
MPASEKIESIAIFGGGTMGPGIALTFARFGFSVCLSDMVEKVLDQSRSVIRSSLLTLAKHKKVKEAEVVIIENRIAYASSFDAAARGADLVVETITEDPSAKKALYRKLDAVCPEKTILLSNTSFLNIFEFMPENRQSRTAIAHWFSPPHILPLVEVVRGPFTSQRTMTTVVDLLKKMGKTPLVMKKYVPGFVINRLQRIIGREVFFLLDNGYITPEELDLAVKTSLAPRMMLLGLAKRYDFTGLDLSARNLENPDYPDPPLDNRPRCLFERVEKGHLGVKTGKGFYDYGDQPLEEILRQRDEELLKIMECIQVPGRDGK